MCAHNAPIPLSTYAVRVLGLLLCQSRDAQHLGGLQERLQGLLVHIHLAMIDELHQRVKIIEIDVLQQYDGMFAGCALFEEGVFGG